MNVGLRRVARLPASWRGRALRVALCGLCAPCGLAIACAPDPAELARPAVYALALHVHGSLSEGPASMAAHDAATRESAAPVDVIWWTDHSWRIRGHTYLDRFDFEQGLTSRFDVPRSPTRPELDRIDDEAAGVATPLELARLGIEARETATASWVTARGIRPPAASDVGASDVRAFAGQRSLRLAARSGEADWQGVALALRSDRRRHLAPLAAGARLRLAVWPEALGRDTRLVVRAVLSQQPGHGPARIDWTLRGPGQEEGPPGLEVSESKTPSGAGVRIARLAEDVRAGAWNELELDLSALAREAELGGADASLQRVELRLEVRGDAAAVVFVDELEIVRAQMGDPLFAWQAGRAAELSEEAADGRRIQHHVGQEISYAAHLNAYGGRVPLVDLSERPNGLTPGEAVSFTHAHGGIVSLNHPFGIEFALARSTTPQALARLAEHMRDLAARRAHGVDLLEVGYRARGRDLQAHLDLWDTLSRAGVFVTGVGTSDTHDARQGWANGPNDFVTWVHARSSSQEDLIEGLLAGRAFFGDPARFGGRIELAVPGRGDMGAVIARGADALRSVDAVEARVSGLRAGQRVVWVEDGERIEAGEGVGERGGAGAGSSGGWRGEHRLRSPGAGFVRLEVHDEEGPVALSNPIYFVAGDAEGVPAARDPERRGAMLYPWADAVRGD